MNRNKFINKIISSKKITFVDNRQKEEVVYFLEWLFIFVPKLLLIIIVSISLNLFVEILIFLLLYNFIRFFSFGPHLENGFICSLFSLVLLIGLPIIGLNITINNFLKFLIFICCFVIFIWRSPGTTKKRPIKSFEKWVFFKVLSCLVLIVYSFISINLNNYIGNFLIMSVFLQSFIISPLGYFLFNYFNRKEV